METTSTTTFSILNTPARFPGVHVGRVVDIRKGGRVLVDFADNPFGPAVARLTKSVSIEDALAALQSNAQVMLAFEGGDPSAPILFDVIAIQESEPRAADEFSAPAISAAIPMTVVDSLASAEPGHRDFLMATICGIHDGVVEVRVDGADDRRFARTAVTLRNLTSHVLLAIPANGDPVIVGQLYEAAAMAQPGSIDADVVLRGNRIRIEAECEVTLKAGKCEIQLDARGKATTVADQVVSRARGVNKVQGGSVQLN